MITLTSSIVIPSQVVEAGRTQVQLCRLDEIELTEVVWGLTQNFHGHQPTIAVLEGLSGRTLPPSTPGTFWDGEGFALSVRPKSGVRGGGNKEVNIEDLEAVLYRITTPEYREAGESTFETWSKRQIKQAGVVYSQWRNEGYLPPAIADLSWAILALQPDPVWQGVLHTEYPNLTADGEWWRKGERK